jgi:hypothetical protein
MSQVRAVFFGPSPGADDGVADPASPTPERTRRFVTVPPALRKPGRPRPWLRTLGWAAAAVALGLGTAWWSVRGLARFGADAGPWRASLLAGSADADVYTRARVAIGGLLALNRDETLYYVAATDSDGQPLRSRCAYRVSGPPPPGRWWSVTAYADDFFLFADPQQRYSLNGATATLDVQGHFALVSGPLAPAGSSDPWLPTTGERGLLFTLRVYNPAASLQADPASLQPPRIQRLGACA